MDEPTRDLLAHLWAYGTYGYYLALPNPRTLWMPADQPKELRPSEKNLYFGVHPVAKIPPANVHGEPVAKDMVRGRGEDVTCVSCLFAEFDARDGLTKEKLTDRIRALKLPPSAIVDSGGGYHCYWYLTYTWALPDDSARAAWSQLQRRFVQTVGGDGQVFDLARVLRIPGTLNHKYPDKPRVQVVDYHPERAYSVAQIKLTLPPLTKTAPRDVPRSSVVGTDQAERLIRAALKHSLGRNAGGMWLACQLRDNGYVIYEAQQHMLAYRARTEKKNHPYTEREAIASLQQAYKRSPREPLAPLKKEAQ